MSSSIWTQCAGESEVRPLALEAYRAVEAQHQIATRKLVDSDAEQQALEEMIERVKPPAVGPARLHYLLSTPFRYPPLRYGSRFGTRAERGIWYGSAVHGTLFAEVAYYRLLFLHGTSADLGIVATELTTFRATLRASRSIDLTTAPFGVHAGIISSPTSYVESQALGRAMREAAVEAFVFISARDAERGRNVGAFEPSVFGRRQPRDLETWYCTATRAMVEVTRRDYFRHRSFTFPVQQFLVEGSLPTPAL
ncbi:MAG TPA: RES family NAD+ phosphorylase [Gemmatimonadaceae bacterium]|nr:RES family NAD+ phosphorylase [Gemmatimonadaceae bacterium]